MIDILAYKITQSCPKCSKGIEVTMSQLANELKVHCSCGHIIQLKDPDGNYKQIIRDLRGKVNKVFR